MKEILIATGNEGKKQELLDFFQTLSFKFLSLRDFDSLKEPEETGQNFEENALLKARYYGKKLKISALGEDSGLILSAYPDKFGLRTRREIAAKNDEAWLEQFLHLLQDQPNRQATFYSAIAFFDPQTQTEKVFLGQTSGVITQHPQAKLEPGIPVSAVFIPSGHHQVFSSMSKKQKNQVSHRGKSARQMDAFLRQFDWKK